MPQFDTTFNFGANVPKPPKLKKASRKPSAKKRSATRGGKRRGGFGGS